MKILIDLPDEVSDELILLAEKKGWNRKQYIQWQLTAHANLTKSRALARISNGSLNSILNSIKDSKNLKVKK